jgi:hypothetical protein
MVRPIEPVEVRSVDAEGRVLVGPSLAGKHVRVEIWQDGVFLRFLGTEVAEGDPWWLKDPDKLKRALSWGAEPSPLEMAVSSAATPSAPKKKRKGKGKRKKR